MSDCFTIGRCILCGANEALKNYKCKNCNTRLPETQEIEMPEFFKDIFNGKQFDHKEGEN